MTLDEQPGPHAPTPAPPALPGASAPMRVAAVMEIGLGLVLRRWRTVLALALVFSGPAALLTAAAGIRFNSVAQDVGLGPGLVDATRTLTTAEFERLGGALVAVLLASLVAGMLGSIGAVGISAAVLGVPHAWTVELGGALRLALRRAPSVIAFMLATSAVMVALVLGGLVAMTAALAVLSSGSIERGGPGVFGALIVAVAVVVTMAYLTMRWAAAYPVMAIEGAGWRAALRRSWQLSADNVLRVAGIVVFTALLTALSAAVMTQLLAIVVVDGLAVGAGLDPLVAEGLVMAVVAVVVAPVAPALLAVLYTDLRTRQALSAGGVREGAGRGRG